jgi:hypothetical protein
VQVLASSPDRTLACVPIDANHSCGQVSLPPPPKVKHCRRRVCATIPASVGADAVADAVVEFALATTVRLPGSPYAGNALRDVALQRQSTVIAKGVFKP